MQGNLYSKCTLIKSVYKQVQAYGFINFCYIALLSNDDGFFIIIN